MSKKARRYSFYSSESSEELIARIEAAVPLYNTERYGKELRFVRTEHGFSLEVMRGNFGTHIYEEELVPSGGTRIDGELHYVAETENARAIDRFFHRAGFVICCILLFPLFLVAGGVIIARMKGNGSPLTKEKTLLDFMQNFVLCEPGKEN